MILVKDPPTASVRANQTTRGEGGGTVAGSGGGGDKQLEPVFQPSVTAGTGKNSQEFVSHFQLLIEN